MADATEQSDDQLMKVSEVASMFSVETATVRHWLREGLLRGVKIGQGHYWRIPRSEAVRLANSRHGLED